MAVEHEQKEQLSIQVIDQKAELTYLRDFHIREGGLYLSPIANSGVSVTDVRPDMIDLTFEMKLAEGGEGEVWRGALSGKLEKVVIKKAKNAGDAHVWDEAEVAFMMRMKHPRLVTFHGAGVLASGPYPFSVLEFLSGGSIDCRLWNPEPTPRDSVTWQERIRWGSDTAEVSTCSGHAQYADSDLIHAWYADCDLLPYYRRWLSFIPMGSAIEI